METHLCDFCKVKPATSHCGGLCGTVMYCGQQCASKHFNEGHQIECPEAISKIIVELRPKFEKTMFYKASVQKMKSLYDKDIFAWFAFQTYLTNRFINTILFAVKGDWSKFDNSFGKNVRDDPDAKFNLFYQRVLERWQSVRDVRLGAARVQILSRKHLLIAYPQLRQYFSMSNARFTYEFATVMQQTILSMPPLEASITVWRGYTPLNLPGTLAMDLRTFRVGQKITTWGFMSVAINKSIAERYVGMQHPTCCFLRILIPKDAKFFLISGGKNDVNYEAYSLAIKEQTEILLPAGTILKITEIHKTKIAIQPLGNKSSTLWADAMVVGMANIKRTPVPK